MVAPSPLPTGGVEQEPALGRGDDGPVRSTALGSTEIEVIPRRTRCSANSGRLDGAWPHSDEVMPASRAPVMMRAMASSTAASDSSNSSAQVSESRSTPSMSWVRSLEPIDTPSMPMAAYSGMR